MLSVPTKSSGCKDKKYPAHLQVLSQKLRAMAHHTINNCLHNAYNINMFNLLFVVIWLTRSLFEAQRYKKQLKLPNPNDLPSKLAK